MFKRISLALTIIGIGSFLILWKRDKPISQNLAIEKISHQRIHKPQEITTKELSPREEHCFSLRKKLTSSINSFKSVVLFKNLHFKYQGNIYRTRFFHADGDEGSIPTYLVYKEDQNEFPNIIEKTQNSPGKLFLKFQKEITNYIYTEEGVNLINQNDQDSQELFLHREEGNIKMIQSSETTCNF